MSLKKTLRMSLSQIQNRINPEKQKNTDHEQESCDADQNRHPVRQSQAQRLSGSVPDPSCQKTKAAQKHQISSAGNI